MNKLLVVALGVSAVTGCAPEVVRSQQPPLPAPTPTATNAADELVGLWKAKRWFGPFARGALIITESGGSYVADMVGQRVPVRRDAGELVFDLPNSQGTFRGKLQPEGGILGQWFPPKNTTVFAGAVFASPVRLTRLGPSRWRGEVVPFEDVFTLFLMVQKHSDGSLHTFLNNPERAHGASVDRLTRVGNVVKLIAKRGGADIVFATGSYDHENQVISISLPNRGGTYDFRRDDDQSAFYPRGRNPGRYVYHQPLARDDGWPTGTLDEVNIDRAGIERFIQMIIDTPMESIATPIVEGVLIARHGKLVLEEYFHDEHRDKLHETRSAAKSLTATIVGAAIHAGGPLTVTSPVYRVMNGGVWPTDLDPRKRAMTMEHLLTMSSGYFCDDGNPAAPGNEEVMLGQAQEPDYYRFTLKVAMAWNPGERAVYCSVNPNLALGMVGRATGESPMYTFDRLLGNPMKIHAYGWLLDPAGQPYGGGSVKFLPRDFMKFGQLMLNDGMWGGRRLLGRDFVARASSRLYHLNNIYYGYAWWGIDWPYKNRTVRAYFAGGNGGQAVIVVPELDLVIATYGANYAHRVGLHIQQNLPPNYILPAVREPGDDKSEPVIERDFSTPYGRSPNGSSVSATRRDQSR